MSVPSYRHWPRRRGCYHVTMQRHLSTWSDHYMSQSDCRYSGPTPARSHPHPGCNARAIRRPGHGIHPFPVAAISEEPVPIIGIPHLYRSTMMARGDPTAIGRPGHAIHLLGLSIVGQQLLTSIRVPYPYMLTET